MFLLTLLRDYGGLAATDHSRPPLSNKTSLTPRLCSTAGSKGIHFDLRRPDAWKNHCSVVRRAQHLRDQGVLRCTSRQSSPVWFHCLHRLHLMDHCYCIARVLQLRPDSDMTASLHFILETQRLRGHAGRVSPSPSTSEVFARAGTCGRSPFQRGAAVTIVIVTRSVRRVRRCRRNHLPCFPQAQSAN